MTPLRKDPSLLQINTTYDRYSQRINATLAHAIADDSILTPQGLLDTEIAMKSELVNLHQTAVPQWMGMTKKAYQDGVDSTKFHSFAPANTITDLDQTVISLLEDQIKTRVGKLHVVLGRRIEDSLRAPALKSLRKGITKGETPEELATRIANTLDRMGLSYNGTIKGGKTVKMVRVGEQNWQLDNYARMYARTTHSSVFNRAVLQRCVEANHDLVKVAPAGERSDTCEPYVGMIFSISGKHPFYPALNIMLPLHPNCIHYFIVY